MRLFVVFCTLWLTRVSYVRSDEPKIVCYFGSWAVYRTGNGKIEISDIEPSLCTHLVYTFVGLSEDGSVRVLDAWNDLADNYGKAGFQKFNALRKRSAGTKTLIAIGGWNEGSEKYSKVVGNSETRARFVKNVAEFTVAHGFDGFDLDWEYPNQRGGNAADVRNYVELLRELRDEFDKNGLILSAAVAAAEKSAALSYDIPQVSKYLDFINLMSYDLHGSWDTVVGHNAPLYAAARETTASERNLNVNATIHYWLSAGAPASKLVVGTAFYGRTFTLSNAAQNAPGSPASGAGQAGPYTQQSGMLGYNEICELLGKGTWTSVWDEEQRVPYAYKGDQWVGYDNAKSIAEKAELIKSLGLGGAMLWSVETDDFRGLCGDRYPLLKSLNGVLRPGITIAPPPTPANPTSTASTSGTPKVDVPTTRGNDDSDEESNIICNGAEDGYVRDTEDCSKFWVCQPIDDHDWKPVLMNCGAGLYFDVEKLVCNYEDVVQC